MSLDILITCDTNAFGTYLCDVLTAKGHHPSCVPDGKEAFRAVRLHKPDLIIVEIAAAASDAPVTEQRLYNSDAARKIPVIVVSDCLKLESELVLVFDFLAKPLDLGRLLDDIDTVSSRRALPRTPATLSDQHHRAFSSHVLSCTGLHFEPRNHSALERGLWKRMSVLRIDNYDAYLAFLKLHGEDRHELQKLLQFLTVGETYFFRYQAHFDALKKQLLATPVGKIRIWSAGCSTGEEPYSIAMTVMETFPDWRSRDIKILATDINNQSLKRARDGVYSSWSMRTTDVPTQERYFHRVGQSFLIKEEVKQLVDFSHLNLSCDGYSETPLQLKELDAIFCRNVMIYFSPENAARLVEHFAASLKVSGQLFLGHVETLSHRATDLEIRRQENSFYYRKVARSTPPPAPCHLANAVPPPAVEVASPGKPISQPKNSTKPAAKVKAGNAAGASPPSPPAPASSRQVGAPPDVVASHSAQLARARALYDAEDFDAAEAILETLLRECPDHSGALILKGFLLAGKGRVSEALEVSQRVLEQNDLLAEAYFLRGVLLDANDQLAEAADEYRKALLLDHDFIMPRYHMGRLHLRLGRDAEAAREIRNSIRILSRHEDQGTVPYSGGLTRAVCLVQLQNALAQVA